MDYKKINDYEIIYMINENTDESKDFLYKKYMPIIKKIAVKYFSFAKSRGCEFDDLVQEGYIGFNSAINSFKDNMNCSFFTFASLCIERNINCYCKKLNSFKSEVLNISYYTDYEEAVNKYSYNIDDSYFDSLERFIYIKNILSFKQSCVFELKYNGFNYQEISNLLDIPINTVDSRLCKIRKTIRQIKKS